MYPFTYKVEYYDEVDYATHVKTGFLHAERFGEAMEQLSEYYGEKAIGRVELEAWVDGPIELPESLLREVMEKRENKY